MVNIAKKTATFCHPLPQTVQNMDDSVKKTRKRQAMSAKLPGNVEGSRLLNYRQMKALLHISDRHLWRLISCDDPDLRIPSYKFGTVRRFKWNEVLWWLEKHRSA